MNTRTATATRCPAAPLVVRPSDVAGGRGASDVSSRRQRREPGYSRCGRLGATSGLERDSGGGVRRLRCRDVLTNRRGGPEGVIDLVESRAPEGFNDVDVIRARLRGNGRLQPRAGQSWHCSTTSASTV